MAIKYIETKSETGRSGIRVEFDTTTDIVKLSGFYDTYVKLHLKKSEWKLNEFLEFLGIHEILSKKLGHNFIINDIVSKEEPKSVSNSKNKKVTSSKPKLKTLNKSSELENSSNLTKASFEFDNLPKIQTSYSLKKSSTNPQKASLQVNISVGYDKRLRFIVPESKGFSMSLWLSDMKTFDKKHKEYQRLDKLIKNSIEMCKNALSIKDKEMLKLKNSKKNKFDKSNIDTDELFRFVKDYCYKNTK